MYLKLTMAGNLTDNDTLQIDQIKTITYVYIAFLTPSVIGSFSVFLVSLLRWRNLQEQRQLLVQLSLADLLASSVLLSITSSNVISTGQEPNLCLYGLPLALVFYCLSFMLVNSYALKSKNVVQGWRTRPAGSEDVQSGRTKENVHYALLWVFLIGVYVIYAVFMASPNTKTRTGITEPEYCKRCILFSHVWKDDCSVYDFKHQAPVYFFLFFLVVEVILSCTVIYHDIFKWHEGQQQRQQGLFPVEGDGQSTKRFKHLKYTARNRVLVIIVCWTPALLLFGMTWAIEQSRLFPLYIIQAATVSLQGFVNSMVYAWKRPNFTEAVLGERTPLIIYNHVSFFEESLKTSV
ncbi:hypothetical protein NL108_012326 [Boleophthalmus pectinirostris]|uniref:uncharacterized protein si:dkey-30c15.2 n=1 Tax=Boleophthalmus pectinirostris TaxID=150288 RepID=UPI0024312D0B|nr:uncharacterized protein si:dkey-30c15.2 [Boleophthalmus pectinirostris]KAJ0069694.1 hypothetical protein NL108_012326 [Boleophthalmus pectinirostris]